MYPLLKFLIWRLINVSLVRTFFQPDEFFQSLEPAWALAFGKSSGAWITWEWNYQLRSALHPLLFATSYKLADGLARILEVSSHSRATLLLAAPKIVQACIAGLGDFYGLKLARLVYGNRTAGQYYPYLTAFSAWQWFCSTRTLSNSLETTLTAAALAYWPWSLSTIGTKATASPENKFRSPASRVRLSLTLAAFACMLRPTNILIWLSLSLPIIARSDLTRLTAFLANALLCGTAVASLSAIADHAFYGQWTFPPLHFLQFNLVQSLAVFYGANDWHYYLSQGFPMLLTTYLPVGIWGLVSALRSHDSMRFQLASAAIVMLAAFSFISHKEARFIYPLLPIVHALSIEPCQRTWSWLSARPRRKTIFFVIFALLQSSIVYYTAIRHQAGVIRVMDVLRSEYEEVYHGQNMTVGFLTPCHSTPWRSHLVYPEIQAWALTCEPPIDVPKVDRGGYVDEADRFYANPTKFLWSEVGNRERGWPQYLVFFEQLQLIIDEIRPAISARQGLEYPEKFRIHNSDWHDDSRRRGDIIVLKRELSIAKSQIGL